MLSLRFMFEKVNINLTSQLEIEQRPTRHLPWGGLASVALRLREGQRPWVSRGQGRGGQSAACFPIYAGSEQPSQRLHRTPLWRSPARRTDPGQADRPGTGGVTAATVVLTALLSSTRYRKLHLKAPASPGGHSGLGAFTGRGGLLGLRSEGGGGAWARLGSAGAPCSSALLIPA